MKQLISYSLLNSSDVTGSRYIHVGTTCQLICGFEALQAACHWVFERTKNLTRIERKKTAIEDTIIRNLWVLAIADHSSKQNFWIHDSIHTKCLDSKIKWLKNSTTLRCNLRASVAKVNLSLRSKNPFQKVKLISSNKYEVPSG